jgi:hydroxymethylglutaryl-CoA reductase
MEHARKDDQEWFTSRLVDFYRLSLNDRVAKIKQLCHLSETDELALSRGLSTDSADHMIENAIGVFGVPLGLGLNLRVNGRDWLVPMAIEEPSVVAALSFAAKIVRGAGGFSAESDLGLMVGQVQVQLKPEDVAAAVEALRLGEREVVASANRSHPQLLRRGGGARALEVHVLDSEQPRLIVVHLLVDVLDAMGANIVNSMAEAVAPLIEFLTGGKVYLRILSNLADHRCARARCTIPIEALADFDREGLEIATGIIAASRFAESDSHRAATHNKGIMNGIDAVALATGNDWRAIEAGAHAFAAMQGRYRPLSSWWLDGDRLVGTIELPLAVGTVGGATRVHPLAQLALKILGSPSARELAQVMAAVGLAQNLAALRALGSVGIQRGHMLLHHRGDTMLSEGRERNTQPVPSGVLRAVPVAAAADLPQSARRFTFRVPKHWLSSNGKSPYAAEAEKQVIAWFERLGCSPAEVARVRRFDAAGYVGVPFPNFSAEVTTRVGKHLSMWLLWDDVHIENSESRWKINAENLAARLAPEPMTRFDHGWWELYLDLAQRHSRRWLDDLCRSMERWNTWAQREAKVMRAVREGASPPPFDLQLEQRIETIGMYPTAYLIEDGYDFELPVEFHAHPLTKRLKKLSNMLVGLGNDVFSLGKDLSEGQINLVSTLMKEAGVGGDEALARVIALHDAAVIEYDEVAAQLPNFGAELDAWVARWVQDIRCASIGFSLWEAQAPRYTAHCIVFDGEVLMPGFEFVEGPSREAGAAPKETFDQQAEGLAG